MQIETTRSNLLEKAQVEAAEVQPEVEVLSNEHYISIRKRTRKYADTNQK